MISAWKIIAISIIFTGLLVSSFKSVQASSSYYFLHRDHQGSIRVVTDENGKEVVTEKGWN